MRNQSCIVACYSYSFQDLFDPGREGGGRESETEGGRRECAGEREGGSLREGGEVRLREEEGKERGERV